MTDAFLVAEAIAWLRRRNSLSADCAKLGIGPGKSDTPKWVAELLRREEPFRKAVEQYVKEHDERVGAEVPDAEALAWIRRKLELPPDTKMFEGTPTTIAGALHVLCSHAQGYETYIKAFRCDDKQGEIARLTVQLAEAREEIEQFEKAKEATG